jgi:hypothetical protein
MFEKFEQFLKEMEEQLNSPENLAEIRHLKARKAEIVFREVLSSAYECERVANSEFYKTLKKDPLAHGLLIGLARKIPLASYVRAYLEEPNKENPLKEHLPEVGLPKGAKAGLLSLIGDLIVEYEDKLIETIGSVLEGKDVYFFRERESKVLGEPRTLSSSEGVTQAALAILLYYCITLEKGSQYPTIDGLIDNILASISFQAGALILMNTFMKHSCQRTKKTTTKKQRKVHVREKEVLGVYRSINREGISLTRASQLIQKRLQTKHANEPGYVAPHWKTIYNDLVRAGKR